MSHCKLELEMATHSSTLALKIPWTEELGAGYYPQGHEESGPTERLHFPKAAVRLHCEIPQMKTPILSDHQSVSGCRRCSINMCRVNDRLLPAFTSCVACIRCSVSICGVDWWPVGWRGLMYSGCTLHYV